MREITVIGTSITYGTTRVGGTHTTPDGSGTIIPNGSRCTPKWRAIDGDWDEHHVWRDRGWWYDHHPEWIHKHHPDWARWRD